jgi:hypothetical protein
MNNEDNELEIDDIDFNVEPTESEEENDDTDEDAEGSERKDKDANQEEILESTTGADLLQLRKERDELRSERDRLTQERDEADFKTREANYASVQTAITRWKHDLTKESAALGDLESQLVEFQINGDVEKAKNAAKNIAERREAVAHLKSEITRYSPLLDQKPVRKEVDSKNGDNKTTSFNAVNKATEMALEWEKENPWYNDPKYSNKREKAKALLTEWINKGYDPSKINFWSRMDSELESFDKKNTEKRRTPPAFRPTSNGGSKQLTTKNKADADILATATELLKRRGVTKDHPNYTNLRKSYYKTAYNIAQKEKANG